MNSRPACAARLIPYLAACALFSAHAGAQDPAPQPVDAPQVDAPQLGPGRGLELTLAAAIEIALQRNLGLQIEALATEIAFDDYQGTWGAFDWRMSARAALRDGESESQDIFAGASVVKQDTQSFNVDFQRPLATTGGTFAASFDSVNTRTNSDASLQDTSTNDAVSLSYVQPLLRGAWREYATSVQKEAHLVYRQQNEHERQVSDRLIYDVSIAYWNLVAAREQLSVAESSLNLAKQQVDQNRRRLEAGVGTEVEVLQAEAEVAMRDERRIFFELSSRQSADALKALLFPGKDKELWETSLIPRTPLPEQVSGDVAPLWTAALEVAIERRAELAQQRLSIDTFKERHDRARAERKPQLDLELTATSSGFDGDSSQAFEKAVKYDFPTYGAALNFNFPLENTTARYTERSTWAQLRQARLVYDQLESQIVSEVRDAVRQVVYQAEAVRAALKSLELARRQLQAEQARYQEGLSTTFQVLQFQQDLAQAMFSERQSRANYAKALVSLSLAQGMLGETVVR